MKTILLILILATLLATAYCTTETTEEALACPTRTAQQVDYDCKNYAKGMPNTATLKSTNVLTKSTYSKCCYQIQYEYKGIFSITRRGYCNLTYEPASGKVTGHWSGGSSFSC